MKRSERSPRYRLLAAWRTLLANANHLAVNVEDPEELASIASVKDYIIEQIEACEVTLIIRGSSRNRTPDNEQFATLDNRHHNGVNRGLENA